MSTSSGICCPSCGTMHGIVLIGSMMGVYPHSTSLAYGMTKSAIHVLAKNLMKVFEGTGTTVNAIAPGFVNGSVIEINGGYCFK